MLEFEVLPRVEGGSLLIQTASFDPSGLAGLFYWYALYPIHQKMFSGMAKAIVRRAEADVIAAIPPDIDTATVRM